METVIAYLYTFTCTIAFIAYFPQLKLLFKCRRAPDEISVKTWTIWFLHSLVAMLYGIYCLQDWLFCVMTGIDLAFMAMIIALVIHNRYVIYGEFKSFWAAFFTYYLQRPFFKIEAQTIPITASNKAVKETI